MLLFKGPPGTGKTTVLTAIIERLNEESDKENIQGANLSCWFSTWMPVENIIQTGRYKMGYLPKLPKTVG